MLAQVTLIQIDPETKAARYYTMSLNRSLFGEWILMRNWGRIGQRGQSRFETFSLKDMAQAAFQRHMARKERRGYQCRAQLHISS